MMADGFADILSGICCIGRCMYKNLCMYRKFYISNIIYTVFGD